MQRKRPVVVRAFGKRLKGLRGRLSRQQVVNKLKNLKVTLDPSTLHQYEHGTVAAPDPVVLMGLAAIYRTDIRELVAVLAANRADRNISDADVGAILQQVRTSDHENAAAALRLAELCEEFSRIGERILVLSEEYRQPGEKDLQTKSR